MILPAVNGFLLLGLFATGAIDWTAIASIGLASFAMVLSITLPELYARRKSQAEFPAVQAEAIQKLFESAKAAATVQDGVIENLREEVTKLSTQNSFLQDEVKELRSLIDELRKAVEDHREKVDQVEREKAQVMKIFEEKAAELHDLQSKFSLMEDERNHWRNKALEKGGSNVDQD